MILEFLKLFNIIKDSKVSNKNKLVRSRLMVNLSSSVVKKV